MQVCGRKRSLALICNGRQNNVSLCPVFCCERRDLSALPGGFYA